MEKAAAFRSNHFLKSSFLPARDRSSPELQPPLVQSPKGALLQKRWSQVHVFLHGCPHPCQSLPYLLTLHSYSVWLGIMFWATLCLSSRLPPLRKELSYSMHWLPLICCWWGKSSTVMWSPPKRSSDKSKCLSPSCSQQEIASLSTVSGRISCVGLQVFDCNRWTWFLVSGWLRV